jgi:hypothetical protein
MNRRTVAWVAVSLGSLNVAFSLLSLHFAALNGYSLALYFEELILPAAILAVSFSVVGVLVASHRPRNPWAGSSWPWAFPKGSFSSLEPTPSTCW